VPAFAHALEHLGGYTPDVVNDFLTVITNGKVTTDMVGPHPDLMDEIPYVGPPNAAKMAGEAGSGSLASSRS
jgi:hypothetical protein